ncbi:MAG: Sbal_3080 family lipoprotein, partial [Burkholderiales bacterium]
MKTIYLALIMAIFLTGCTTVQQITKLDAGKVSNVCIVEHKEVRETVLETIEEGLTRHGVKYRVIPGSYVIKDNRWIPTFQSEQASDCDAVLFYVANWTWDITMYMHFANIWMTTPDRKMRLGNASYDARASLNKFINAHDKLIELVDGIFNEYKNANSSV